MNIINLLLLYTTLLSYRINNSFQAQIGPVNGNGANPKSMKYTYNIILGAGQARGGATARRSPPSGCRLPNLVSFNA